MTSKNILSFCAENNIEWAFFDFFGTCVHRNCNSKEVKELWAKKLEQKLCFNISKKDIFEVRILAEDKLWLESKNIEVKYNKVLEEVYIRLEKYFNLDKFLDKDTFLQTALQCEIESEKESQLKCDFVIGIIKSLFNKGIKIAIVSDFYLDKKAFCEFLQYHGLLEFISEIFVSSGFGEKKATGKLYDIVLGTLNVPANKCIMVGDNKVSDIKNALKKGIKSFKINSFENYKKYDLIKTIDNIYKSHYKGELRYSNYAFSLGLFCERLYKDVINKNIKNLYFLSREGQFLKVLFDKYLHLVGDKSVCTHYIYVSRKAVYPLELNELKEEKFLKLKGYNTFSVKDFFDNIGIDEYSNLAILKEYDVERQIPNFFESQEFVQLTKDIEFENLYKNKLAQNKKLIKDYIQNAILDNNDELIALVDVGWSATMQDALANDLSKYNFEGFYVGLINSAKITENSKKNGLLFSKVPCETPDYDIWSYDHVFFERLLTANHGATEKYEQQNDTIEPVLKEYQCESGNFENIKSVQKALLEKFEAVCFEVINSPYYLQDFYFDILRKHIKTVFTLNSKQIILQKQMIDNQVQNFGNIAPAKQSLDAVFSKKHILKKSFHSLRLFKNTEVVFRVLQRYNAKLLIKIVYYFKRKKLLKKARKII